MAAIEILGVENRVELATKIFDRYKEPSPALHDALSVDAFFTFVGRTFDDELSRMTRNPLFLTVMCYTYVKHVEHGTPPERAGRTSVRTLVLACLQLLLHDLDENRVRNLPDRIRRALAEKRGLYTNEKLDFLGYFASQLLANAQLSGAAAFTERTITSAAKRHFERQPLDDTTSEILSNLHERSAANLVRQLILQGIFVIVDTLQEEPFYDFPHRRFREVLAARYLCAPEHIEEFLGKLGDPHYRELTLLAFRLEEQHRERILHTMLESSGDHAAGRYYLDLAAACVDGCPEFDPTVVLERWLGGVVDRRLLASVPGRLLHRMTPSHQFLVAMDRRLSKCLAQADGDGAGLIGGILWATSRSTIESRIHDAMKGDVHSSPWAPALLRVVHQQDPRSLGQLLTRTEAFTHWFALIAEVMITAEGVSGREPWWKWTIRQCGDEQLVALARMALRLAPRLAPRVFGFEELAELPTAWMERTVVEAQAGAVYVVARGRVADLPNARGRIALLDVKEGFYKDLSFLPDIPMPRFQDVAQRLYRAHRKEAWAKRDGSAEDAEGLLNYMAAHESTIKQEMLRIHVEDEQATLAFVQRMLAWDVARARRIADALLGGDVGTGG